MSSGEALFVRIGDMNVSELPLRSVAGVWKRSLVMGDHVEYDTIDGLVMHGTVYCADYQGCWKITPDGQDYLVSVPVERITRILAESPLLK